MAARAEERALELQAEPSLLTALVERRLRPAEDRRVDVPLEEDEVVAVKRVACSSRGPASDMSHPMH
jgi:hypothetical protein